MNALGSKMALNLIADLRAVNPGSGPSAGELLTEAYTILRHLFRKTSVNGCEHSEPLSYECKKHFAPSLRYNRNHGPDSAILLVYSNLTL